MEESLKEKQNFDLVICLPGNEWDLSFIVNLENTRAFLKEADIRYAISMEGGSNVSFVREACLGMKGNDAMIVRDVKPFFGTIKYKYILWIDSDITFDPSWIKKMMDYDRDIVTGFYKKSLEDFCQTQWRNDKGPYHIIREEDLKNKKDLIRLKWSGMGFALIKREVFEKIPRPWFLTTVVDYGLGPRMAGEDVYFCLQAEKYGFEIWGDPEIICGHLKKFPLK